MDLHGAKTEVMMCDLFSPWSSLGARAVATQLPQGFGVEEVVDTAEASEEFHVEVSRTVKSSDGNEMHYYEITRGYPIPR